MVCSRNSFIAIPSFEKNLFQKYPNWDKGSLTLFEIHFNPLIDA